jgi:hypothetical protein
VRAVPSQSLDNDRCPFRALGCLSLALIRRPQSLAIQTLVDLRQCDLFENQTDPLSSAYNLLYH